MRVGILTFHNSRNFGANLQTLATQEMLRKLGHEPVIINYVDREKASAFERMVPPAQIEEHERFARRYYNLSAELNSTDALADFCREDLDAVVCGSDAVFRMGTPFAPKRIGRKLLGRSNPYASFSWDNKASPFFLPFDAPGVVKGSIAASSRGTSFYFLRPSVMREVGSALRDFDFVTVRDDWTATLVRWLSLGGAVPQYSPDPVFGLNSAFSVPEDEKPSTDLSSTILLTGQFDRGWLGRMVEAIHRRGYRAAVLSNPSEMEGTDLVDEVLSLPMGPLTWYSALASCAGFIGMRFHAYVSSLANNTPVVTMDVAKPWFRDRDPRNPNCDLARRAGIENNYFVRRDLMAAEPDLVLDRLFDPVMRERAAAFAAKAPGLLFEHLRKLETAAGEKG